ncbi:LON peptidase substrate-binding domain-containing protein [Phycicoccus sp. BSK3Z-2]|uniref:LON peptidase substrate-binding domain-containing protein n=1 Tax=Phycicoccus avicenniae TaxID=2828860 RepID=A0A941D7C4_9MICO|nr:LON peptidase substrate-binding domain-containing protein [Phycicoccus avicenniae]MBR7742458.1 LON peptidase substrate-binding domain-containing protein [Phycicoccus avicenniae]
MSPLPLFPLGTVLLPGGRLPLQLFEPRYLRLAQDLAELPEGERRFGVLLIRQGHEVGDGRAADLQGIGCEAVVDAMALAEGPSGTVVHLVGRGARRFRLDRVDDAAGTPYVTGDVTWLEDEPVPEDAPLEALAARVRLAHEQYLDTVGATAEPLEALAKDVPYRVAERMVLDVADRQRVLDGPDPATRLRTVLSLLRRETAIVGEFGALPSVPEPEGPSLN